MPVFPQSAGLKAILEAEGFGLYWIPQGSQPGFTELQARGLKREYEIGAKYFLLPLARLSESLTTITFDTPRPIFRGARLDRLTILEFLESGLVIKQVSVVDIKVSYDRLIDEFRTGFRGTKSAR